LRRWIRALETRATTREKVVAQNRVDRVEAVLPADFFPFVISPAVVGNAYFINAAFAFANFAITSGSNPKRFSRRSRLFTSGARNVL